MVEALCVWPVFPHGPTSSSPPPSHLVYAAATMTTLLTPRQDLALRGLAAAALALFAVCGALVFFLLRAWGGMPEDTREIGIPALHLARILPHLALEVTLGGLAGSLALSLLGFRAWVAGLPDRDDRAARRAFIGAVQGFRWMLGLGVLTFVGLRLWAMGQPQPTMQLLPAGLYAFLTVVLVGMLAGPLLGLLWWGVGGLSRWAGRVGLWQVQPGPSGALHRALRDAISPLKYAAALLLGLGLWMLPATLMEVTTSAYHITAFDEVLAGQLQPIIAVVVGLLLTTGLTLVLWRSLTRQVCHVLDGQRSLVSELIYRSPVAEVDRTVRETPASVLRRAVRPPY